MTPSRAQNCGNGTIWRTFRVGWDTKCADRVSPGLNVYLGALFLKKNLKKFKKKLKI
jgi:hypothetical protein